MVYFQSLKVVATAGNTVYDEGLRSTTENPKTLLSVMCQIKEEPEHDCMLQIWYEKELISEIPTRMIDSGRPVGGTPYSYNRLNEIEVGFAIPVGAVVKVASKAVSVTQTIIGAYRYEITG